MMPMALVIFGWSPGILIEMKYGKQQSYKALSKLRRGRTYQIE